MIYTKNIGEITLTVKKDLTMSSALKKLTRYTDTLISCKAITTIDGYSLSVDDLDNDEKGNLAALFLELHNRDTSDCFIESDKYAINDNITCALLALLKDESPDAKEDLADLIRNNVIKKYHHSMQSIINERCQELYSIHMNENGFFPTHHFDNGETYWRKQL